MTVDLDAVPRRRPGGGRRPAARRPARARGQPREPGRRHARRHARGRPPRRGARRHRRRRSAPTPSRRSTTSSPASSASGPTPTPTAPYDLLVISDCGSLERIGEVGARHADLFARLPRVIIDHHASNDAAEAADWIDPDAAATCEMVTLLAGRLGVPLDAGDGALAAALMAGIVMDTATFAHPNATPRTLVVSAALVEAGAPLSDISRRLYRTKPDAQLRLFGVVLDRLESADDGRIVWSTLTDADYRRRPAPSGRTRRASSTCSPRPRPPRSRSCSRRPTRQGDAGQRPDEAGRRRRDGPDRPVRWRRTCPGGRRLDRVIASRTRDRRSSPRRPGSSPRSSADVARSSLGPGLDGILVVAKPAGPTSHDVVALVRRLAATKRVGHGGTLDPFASGVLPVFLGHATRVVEYHLGDRKAYRATVCFGASSTTDDLEGELTPGHGPGPDASRGRGGPARPDRPDLAAAAGLQRDQGRRPPRVRDGPCRRDRRAGVARGHDPRARPRLVGRHGPRPPDRRPRRRAARPGPTCGRSPATSGSRSGARPTSAR